MEITYVALDGTKFYNEQDCLEYEKRFATPLQMYNEFGHPETDIKGAYYIFINNASQFSYPELKQELFNDNQLGLYAWDDGFYSLLMPCYVMRNIKNILNNIYPEEEIIEDEK